jgi:hypothetical protein
MYFPRVNSGIPKGKIRDSLIYRVGNLEHISNNFKKVKKGIRQPGRGGDEPNKGTGNQVKARGKQHQPKTHN